MNNSRFLILSKSPEMLLEEMGPGEFLRSSHSLWPAALILTPELWGYAPTALQENASLDSWDRPVSREEMPGAERLPQPPTGSRQGE
jgi:hypothetical protein